jgi:hypothetical protein
MIQNSINDDCEIAVFIQGQRWTQLRSTGAGERTMNSYRTGDAVMCCVELPSSVGRTHSETEPKGVHLEHTSVCVAIQGQNSHEQSETIRGERMIVRG